MARIPLPNRGQPLDANYLYQVAEAVNALSQEGSALSQGNNFTIVGTDAPESSSKIYGAQIYAAVQTLGESDVSDTYALKFEFTTTFAYAPVVQATIEGAAPNATINIQNLTRSGVTAVVRFAATEANPASGVKVHITAIGLPVS